MRGRRGAHRHKNRRGFTLAELLVGMVIGLILLTAVYQLLIAQSRLYSVQRETMDARESLRAAAALLSWELMVAAATAGDLYAIGPNSLTLRSLQGTGIICSYKMVGPKLRYGLRQVSGYFQAGQGDSALVYSVSADAWQAMRVSKAWNQAEAWTPAPAGGGTPTCFWGDSSVNVPRPQATVELQGDSTVLAGVVVCTPVRAFRRTEYALYQKNGRWWLGRRVGSAPIYDVLAGPLRPPPESGPAFTYYDAAGTVTADPMQVNRVKIVVRAESFGQLPGFAGPGTVTLRDSLTLIVHLRNNAPPQ